MSTRRTVIKLFKRHADGRLTSLISDHRAPQWAVEYAEGEEAVPPVEGAWLFAYTLAGSANCKQTLEAQQKFDEHWGLTTEVWEVDAVVHCTMAYAAFSLREAEAFWEGYLPNSCKPGLGLGVVGCESVTPLRRVA